MVNFLTTPTGVLLASTGIAMVTPLRTRIMVYGMLLYGGLYMYERAAYTKAAQIHRYKSQLIGHTSRKLADLAPHIAFYCLEDLRKSMLGALDASLAEVNDIAVELDTEITDNQQRLDDLNELETAAYSVRPSNLDCMRGTLHLDQPYRAAVMCFEAHYMSSDVSE